VSKILNGGFGTRHKAWNMFLSRRMVELGLNLSMTRYLFAKLQFELFGADSQFLNLTNYSQFYQLHTGFRPVTQGK
jgi:hypothetical protein